MKILCLLLLAFVSCSLSIRVDTFHSASWTPVGGLDKMVAVNNKVVNSGFAKVAPKIDVKKVFCPDGRKTGSLAQTPAHMHLCASSLATQELQECCLATIAKLGKQIAQLKADDWSLTDAGFSTAETIWGNLKKRIDKQPWHTRPLYYVGLIRKLQVYDANHKFKMYQGLHILTTLVKISSPGHYNEKTIKELALTAGTWCKVGVFGALCLQHPKPGQGWKGQKGPKDCKPYDLFSENGGKQHGGMLFANEGPGKFSAIEFDMLYRAVEATTRSIPAPPKSLVVGCYALKDNLNRGACDPGVSVPTPGNLQLPSF